MAKAERTIAVQVRLPETLRRWLAVLAASEGRSQSSVIAELIERARKDKARHA